MSIASNWEKFCKKAAIEEVNAQIPIIQQMIKAASTSGIVKVKSVQQGPNGISVTVVTQDGYEITGVQPGSTPIGPGSTVNLLAGLKLQ